MAYTDEHILSKLQSHLVDELCSKHTMSKPTWQGVLKRMAKSEEFSDKVNNIVAEADKKWQLMGITALLENKENFNLGLYKYMTANKKAFLPHEVLELEARIEELEENAKLSNQG